MVKYYMIPVIFKQNKLNSEENDDHDNKLQSPSEAQDQISLNQLQVLAQVSLQLISMQNSIIVASNSALIINKQSDDPEEASALNKMTFFYLSSAFLIGGSLIILFPPQTESSYLKHVLWMYTFIALMIYQSQDRITQIIAILVFGLVSFSSNILGVVYLQDILPQRTHFYFFTLRGTDLALAGLIFVLMIQLLDFNTSQFVTQMGILLNGLILYYIFNVESPIKLCQYDKQSAEDSMNKMCQASNESFNFTSQDPDTAFSKFNKTRVFFYKSLDIIHTDLVLEDNKQHVLLETGEKEQVCYQSLKNDSVSNPSKFAVFSSDTFKKVETQMLLTASFFQESLGIVILNNFQHYLKTYQITSENTINLIFIQAAVLALFLFGGSSYASQQVNKWIILLGSSSLLLGSTLAGTWALGQVPEEQVFGLVVLITGLQRWCQGIIQFGAVKVQMDQILPEQKSVMQVMFMMVKCIGMLSMSCSIQAMDMDDYWSLLITFLFVIINILCYTSLLIWRNIK